MLGGIEVDDGLLVAPRPGAPERMAHGAVHDPYLPVRELRLKLSDDLPLIMHGLRLALASTD